MKKVFPKFAVPRNVETLCDVACVTFFAGLVVCGDVEALEESWAPKKIDIDDDSATRLGIYVYYTAISNSVQPSVNCYEH